MRAVLIHFCGITLCLLFAFPALAQVADSSYLVVRQVIVKGNKRTRTSIVLRELSLKPGDTIPLRRLNDALESSRKQLLNTSLFLNAVGNVKNWQGREADVIFEVWERWYLFAFPVFKLADRNFNQWWVEQGASIDRINIGASGFQDNLTGRNDLLSADVTFGYTQKFMVSYNLPYLDRTLRHGLGISSTFSRNREVNYMTDGNKQVFSRQDEFARRQFSLGLTYSYRKAIKSRHQVILTYNHESVNDSIVQYNPDYFGHGRQDIRYLELTYKYRYLEADSWQYPLKGTLLEAEASKAGIGGAFSGLDFLRVRLRAVRYWELAPKTYGALGITAQTKFPDDLPYVGMRALGYNEDYLRGLEYYVIDGTSFLLFRSTLRRELLNVKMDLPIVPKKFSNLPIRILAKAYGDMGYAYTKLTRNGILNNKMLYTGGVGLDVVSFYDTSLRVEYSINQLGEKGLFLHAKLDM